MDKMDIKSSEKVNYDKLMQKIIAGFESRPTILLHSCCGPCSTSVIERLVDDFEVTVFFYNPNIDDRDEYELRKQNQIKYINERYGEEKVHFIEGKYDVDTFLEFAEPLSDAPEGGARCALCFEFRLRETARLAAEKIFNFFSTTLTVSPMKNASVINQIGLETAEKTGVKFLVSDFKKRGGYQRSIELSKEYDLYRQHFCGCGFSRSENE